MSWVDLLRDSSAINQKNWVLAREAAQKNRELERYARLDRAALPYHETQIEFFQIMKYPQGFRIYADKTIGIEDKEETIKLFFENNFFRTKMDLTIRADFEAFEEQLERKSPIIADHILQEEMENQLGTLSLYQLYRVLKEKTELRKLELKFRWICDTQQALYKVKNYFLSVELSLLALGTQRSMEHYILPKSLEHMAMIAPPQKYRGNPFGSSNEVL